MDQIKHNSIQKKLNKNYLVNKVLAYMESSAKIQNVPIDSSSIKENLTQVLNSNKAIGVKSFWGFGINSACNGSRKIHIITHPINGIYLSVFREFKKSLRFVFLSIDFQGNTSTILNPVNISLKSIHDMNIKYSKVSQYLFIYSHETDSPIEIEVDEKDHAQYYAFKIKEMLLGESEKKITTKQFKPLKGNIIQKGIDIELLLNEIKNPQENEYLKEAVNCIKQNFLKAATIMIWCAAVNKIHLKIEEIGFDVFNRKSESMYDQQKGRFKRFSKKFNIKSISELREIFDSDLLWLIEGLELVDSNEHERLVHCFKLRNQSAHPGDAPLTEYNVASVFSDITNIILNNEKFEVKK